MSLEERDHAPQRSADEQRLELFIGRLLQVGVLLAAAVVLIGGVMLLVQYGSATAAFSSFKGEPDQLRSLAAIARAAFTGDSRGIVQLGLVLLIITPLARVALTLIAFVVQRDRIFIAITSLVLAILLYGLLWSPK